MLLLHLRQTQYFVLYPFGLIYGGVQVWDLAFRYDTIWCVAQIRQLFRTRIDIHDTMLFPLKSSYCIVKSIYHVVLQVSILLDNVMGAMMWAITGYTG